MSEKSRRWNKNRSHLKSQMRHADVRTTLRVYAHVVPQSQRNSMERIANRSIGTNVPIRTKSIA